MAGSAATPGWFKGQGIWEASISSFEGDIRRRPYHRNCSCALHRSRAVPADTPCPSHSSVSYPIRRRSSSWHSLTSSSSSSSTNLASSSSSNNLASSSNNLASAAAEVNPRVSLDGQAIIGSATTISFMIDDEN